MINEANPFNKYKCFFRGKSTIVSAQTSYEAQCKAHDHFKNKHGYDITVKLLEKDGEPVVHRTSDL